MISRKTEENDIYSGSKGGLTQEEKQVPVKPFAQVSAENQLPQNPPRQKKKKRQRLILSYLARLGEKRQKNTRHIKDLTGKGESNTG